MKLLSAETIRRCLIADEGYSMFSADFDQVELRIVAALSGEPVLIEAAKRGESLHKATAIKLFGANHTPDEYKRTKNVNFTWVFGGGAGTMTRRYGIPFAESTKLIQNYESQFAKLKEFKRRKQKEIIDQALSSVEKRTYYDLRSRMYHLRDDTPQGRKARKALQISIDRLMYRKHGYAVNPFGRRLLVEADKAYKVVNYLVQSTAADIMKYAFLDVMDDPELEPTVLLPIHDELLGQAPIAEAEYIAQRYGEVMSREFMGVPITATGKVYGRSWGHGYRSDST